MVNFTKQIISLQPFKHHCQLTNVCIFPHKAKLTASYKWLTDRSEGDREYRGKLSEELRPILVPTTTTNTDAPTDYPHEYIYITNNNPHCLSALHFSPPQVLLQFPLEKGWCWGG